MLWRGPRCQAGGSQTALPGSPASRKSSEALRRPCGVQETPAWCLLALRMGEESETRACLVAGAGLKAGVLAVNLFASTIPSPTCALSSPGLNSAQPSFPGGCCPPRRHLPWVHTLLFPRPPTPPPLLSPIPGHLASLPCHPELGTPSLSFCVCQSVSVSDSLCVCVSLGLSPSLSLFIPLCVSVSLSLSLYASLSLSVCVSVSVCLSQSLSIFISLSFYTSVCLSKCLCLSLFLFLFLCLSVCL